jgi:hypothetical protein
MLTVLIMLIMVTMVVSSGFCAMGEVAAVRYARLLRESRP